MVCWTFMLVPVCSVSCVRGPHLYPKSTKPHRKQARQVLRLCGSESEKPVHKRSAASLNLHRKLNASPRGRSSRRTWKGVTVQRTPAAVVCETSLMPTGYLAVCSRPASCTRLNRQPNLGGDNSSLGLKIWASVYARSPSSCTTALAGEGYLALILMW